MRPIVCLLNYSLNFCKSFQPSVYEDHNIIMALSNSLLGNQYICVMKVTQMCHQLSTLDSQNVHNTSLEMSFDRCVRSSVTACCIGRLGTNDAQPYIDLNLDLF